MFFVGKCKIAPMKLSLLSLFTLALSFTIQAQSIVVTSPQSKKAILEEFTATNCGNCPSAHVLVNQYQESYQDQLIPINIHYGHLANPRPGQMDFRTEYSQVLGQQAGVGAVPQASINRNATGWALPRNNWKAAIEQIIAQTSPVNVGFEVTRNDETGMISVEIESFNTSELASLKFHVAVLENNFVAYQQDYGNGAQSNYNHQHILRDLPIGAEGSNVPNLTAGAVNTLTVSFEIPENGSGIIENYDVVVFAGDDKKNVFTGGILPATGGTYNGASNATSGIGTFQNTEQATKVFPMPAVTEINISLPGAINENVSLTVFSVNGKAVESSDYIVGADGHLKADVRSFENGAYFFKITGPAGQKMGQGRFIVSR